MKVKLLLCLVLFSSIAIAQKSLIVTLNNGEKKVGFGKILPSGVKLKATKKADYVKIPASEIDIVVQKISKKRTKKFGYTAIKEGKKSKLYEVEYSGNGITLYRWESGSSSNNVGPANVKFKVVRYFVKRDGESIATMIVSGAPLGKSFKTRAKEYFDDCPELVDKIGSKGFKKGDLKRILKFYERTCIASK